MQENDYTLGGEQSGHIIFSKYATTGDGMLTAIKLMQVILDKKTTLSELIRDVQVYPQVLKNVRVTDKELVLNNPDVNAKVALVTDELQGNGRVLLRKSGTEPLIRVMVEAPSYEICEEKVDSIIEVINSISA